MTPPLAEIDTQIRTAVYQHFVEHAAAPTVTDIAARLLVTPTTVREAYQRLYQRRVLVLGPDGDKIVMAPPFSGVPTQHRVHIDDRKYFANCSWDSLGIPAAMHQPATVRSRCEQSGEPLEIRIGPEGPEPIACVAHFAVPAANWWEDIIFT